MVRWGILGPGSIARSFAEGLKSAKDARLIAVGSRSQAKADEFGAKYDVPNRHSSYQALVEDPNVDAIYVATPHPFHKEHCLLALNAGKPTLCEKPFTLNVKEAEEVVRTARERKVFLMEGMWSRFFPLMSRLRALLEAGEIGRVRMVEADFGFRAGFDPKSRLFDPHLGGGALLDVGVYVVSFASMVLGAPDRMTGLATLGATRIDEQAAMVLGHPNGALAILSTAIRTNTAQNAVILGEEGRIVLKTPFWKPESMTVSRNGKPDEEIAVPFVGSGFNYEAEEVGRCLQAGKLESDILPLDETLAIMRTMDTLRAQWGIVYPSERSQRPD
jgi:predicted dehydrogenase